MEQTKLDEKYMKIALAEAKKAFIMGEVPVGCVIVKNEKIIAKAHNFCKKKNLPILHAEIIAIEKACRTLINDNLKGCTMYVTLEPCLMCTGAIINSNISEVVFALPNKESGSLFTYKNDLVLNGCYKNQLKSRLGSFGKESNELLVKFFEAKRNS